MKRSEYISRRRKPVRTLKQLRLEKQRLEHEIDLKELEIKQDYRNLIDTLSFRNILYAIADEILQANTIVSGVYSLLKNVFRRRIL